MKTFAHPSFAGLIGAGREDITPPAGIYARNWGASEHETATGLHHPLTVTALTLRAGPGESPLVLLSADLGWWRRREDEWFVRGGILDALSLDPARLMIHFTHTHSGPSVCREDEDKPGGRFIGLYLVRVRDAAIRAAQRAIKVAKPAVLSWSRGSCDLARNRDLPDPEAARIVCGFNPSGAADDTMLVGRATAQNGTILATLVNYACHPVTLAWQNRLISPDYVGAMRQVVQAQTGNAPCLFLQGASGELAPREEYTGDPSIADAHGRQLGYSALASLEGMLPHSTGLRYEGVVESGAPLAVWARAPVQPVGNMAAAQVDVELPVKAMPSLEEIDAELAACEDRVTAERLARKRRIRRDVGDGQTTPMPLWVWRAGDVAFVGHPNEAYSVLQTELRRRHPDRAIVVMNVTNGHYGYLPPSDLYSQDVYPVWQTPFDRGSLERVIEACGETIDRLFAE